jgi:UPF0148 protein
MDEDEILARITRLLEKGCTMLASHHDCGAPLFRCQGEIVCPVCSFVDDGEKLVINRAHQMEREEKHAHLSDAKEEQEASSDGEDQEMASALNGARASLLKRLRELTVDLEDEQDLDKLKKLLDCMDGLLRALRSL